MANIKVNKIEAARRQIDAAIRMLFDKEDPVAIHTIAMAGFRILRDLADKRDDSHTHRQLVALIKPGMEKELWGQFNSFSNFLKHADNDPDGITDGVDEEANYVILFIACFYYQDLGYQFTTEMKVLVTWYVTIHPEFIREDAFPSNRQALGTANEIICHKPRLEQLDMGKNVLDSARRLPRSY